MVFVDYLGKNIEAYMDDMVVKSGKIPHHKDLLEIFQVMRKYQVRINRRKAHSDCSA